ncbi:hypothetical protein F5148DRAFT_1196222 [Russula earlei]|uniref:Uncharacterized protein n=1 Tax=Russula earlei TaxID=71964 RepID=A0ACC0U9Z0_9AGAM|nr:hypothetical protein F5148DRAFT_1196222 [Russula earlei]
MRTSIPEFTCETDGWMPLSTTIATMHCIRNINIRPVLRTQLLARSVPQAHLVPLATLRSHHSPIIRSTNAFQQHRAVASHVSGRPASQTISQAAVNVREEVGNSTTDWAKVIAGKDIRADDSVKPSRETFLGITSAVAYSVPTPYVVFGLLGGIPYLLASSTTIYLAHQAGLAASGVLTSLDPGVALTFLDRALNIQVTYGAVMLSFLGALHWGMEFAGFGGHKGYSRLALGAAPVIYAWPTLALDPTMALIAQWVGFTALWYADLRATIGGWAPKWYSQYRFYLSLLVGTCIIGTLASTSYWGPVAGHGLLSHDLELIRSQRKKTRPESQGTVAGVVEAVSTGKAGDAYVMVRKRQDKGEDTDKESSQ